MNRTDMAPETSEMLSSLIGKDVVDLDGGTVGQLERVYWRHEDSRPEWGVVSAGVLGKRNIAVPMMDATVEEQISLAYPRDLIDSSPDLEGDVITPESEMDLYRHYNARREASNRDVSDDTSAALNSYPDTGSLLTPSEPAPVQRPADAPDNETLTEPREAVQLDATGPNSDTGNLLAPRETESMDGAVPPLGADAINQRESVAERAYEIYLARGGIDGLDQEDWHRAESEVRGRGT